jgi:hypothetical protein
MMKRKGQVPLPEYEPKDVVRIVLAALQNNDDPQLDHGAAVVLQFRSPSGPLGESKLDAAGVGRFFRDTTEYSALIDFASSELVGNPVPLQDSLSVKQSVKINSWQATTNNRAPTFYDFYLSKIGDLWLLDVILTAASANPKS